MGGGQHVQLRRHGLSSVETFEITADELDRLERDGADIGVDFQIALFCITQAISFLATLIVAPPPSDNVHRVFLTLVVGGFLVGGVFTYRWYRSKGAFATTIQKIRDRPIGPVGSEGHELKASELAILKSEDPAGAVAGE